MNYALLLMVLCLLPALAQELPKAVDCGNPPLTADLNSIYPCIEKRNASITLRNGRTRNGKLRFANKQICDLDGPCEMKIKTRFQSVPVNADEIVSVAYRLPMNGRCRAVGWLVGVTVTGLVMKVLYDQDPEGGAGFIGTPYAVALGAGIGLLSTSINRDAPRTIRIVKPTEVAP